MPLQALKTDYAGSKKGLFKLAVKTSILTVLTLGFYRFWMKTRLRRYYWSSIRPGGVPLEYTGTGVEKMLGFLVAVVFLAFYIGLFNLLLMFASFAVLKNSFAAYATSFIGVIPIYFYASYRARRYILARTRWRGLRFGIDPAAWGYAWRAMGHWLLTIVTLGFLLPRQVFWLEKFRIDRTWFGNQRFVQEGRWQMLIPAARHLYIGIIFTAVAGVVGLVHPTMLPWLIPGGAWLAFGYVSFGVRSFRILTAHKRLGEGVTFTANPRTGKIIRIYASGGFLISISILALGILLAILFFALVLGFKASALDQLAIGDFAGNMGFLFLALGYFTLFIFWGAFGQIFITLPRMRHYAETFQINNGHHLADIQQRARDEMSEAEGFAEALDIGAAI